ncbi:S8 family serine peptidase [Massilia eburnea]|nr:S8 family serine peptidase [Massilia eburnea]
MAAVSLKGTTVHRKFPVSRILMASLVALALLFAGAAQAQGRRSGPSMPVNQSWHSPRDFDNPANEASLLKRNNSLEPERGADIESVRQQHERQARELLSLHKNVIEADPNGQPVLRRQILVIAPDAALAAYANEGFMADSTKSLDELGIKLAILRVPERFSTTSEGLERIHQLTPAAIADFDHVYFSSAAGSGRRRVAGNQAQPLVEASGLRVGLIDSGLDVNHEVFRSSKIERWGCQDQVVPSDHGTAVASLMIGSSEKFQGVLPGATLFAADVYCGLPTGGSASDIAKALEWMARNNVPVINLSLVGPPNQILERAVSAVIQRGHLLTAAVGNDGPAAPPLYPASYKGVIGVSGVDDKRHSLPEAARGPQVAFAAPGSKMVAAATGDPSFRTVRGTSYASPIVAAMLARSMPKPGVEIAAAAVAELTKEAVDARTERSADIGWGIVGEQYRTAK